MNRETDKFLFLGNEPALDLLNTTPVLAEGPVDLLENFGDLTVWLSAAGLMNESEGRALRRRWEGSKEGDAAVAQGKRVRESLREIVTAGLRGGGMPARALEILNDALGAGSATAQLKWNGKGESFSRDVHRSTEGKAMYAVTLLAEAAAALLTEKDVSLIRRCENPSCVLHFYDTSKNHRRRWCSMEICGNRMKAAAHYRRRKEGI